MLPDFVASDLIQHIPEIANGLAGLREYLSQNNDVFNHKIHRIIAEGDFVIVQAENRQMEKATMVYTIFRLSKGKVVEKWGVKQVAPY